MNDIVAEFASSYYKSGETRPNGFSLYDLKQYHVVAGSVFSDEYNETLDSATLVLDHVKKEDRLVDIEPYEYVHVFDKNHPEDFDRIYLVDNFSEQEKNINQHLFSYTISLMSETKLLEKIQCPNVAITHRVQQGATEYLSIYKHMKRYMELYVPYAKMRKSDGTGWEYRQIITIPGTDTDFYTKFNIDCADMAFNMPTLRQLLTTLMQQVGCIPVVRRGVLSYLDLRAEPVSFGRETDDDFTVSRIQRSLSSDSYANTLVNISDNVLDSGNKVVSESLGFRDKNNGILKQTQNLYLDTKFPIYKVNSFRMDALYQLLPGTITNITSTEILDSNTQEKYADLVMTGVDVPENRSYLRVNFELTRQNFDDASANYPYYIDCIRIEYSMRLKLYDSQGVLLETRNISMGADLGVSGQTVTFDQPFLDTPANYSTYYIYFETIKVVNRLQTSSAEHQDQTKYSDGQIIVFDSGFESLVPFSYTADITPLIQENSIRQNLETNYLNMSTASNINDLAKYRYGTVGYSIGSTRISGFSDTYTVAYAKIFGPVYKNYTYLENIITFVAKSLDTSELKEIILVTLRAMGIIILDSQISNPQIRSFALGQNTINFTSVVFNIEYQPLNSFNLSFSKQNRDIPYAIEQLDTNASGLTDFDRLVLREQETVDRIGNVILSVSQRTKNLSQIRGNPTGDFSLTYFLDDLNRDGDYDDPNETRKYILFKRQISVNDYYYDVSYTGMENAILKDYFTSIRTKYRAYELVDYNQSVLRKERDTICVRLGTESINGGGSDVLHFDWENNSSSFIDGFTLYTHNTDEYDASHLISSKNVKYMCEYGRGVHILYKNQDMLTITKNDVSVISSNNILAFIYENSDNAGSGPYISSYLYTTYYANPNYTNDDPTSMDAVNSVKIGGVPQSWQIWKSSYSISHPVVFVGTIGINYEKTQTNGDYSKIMQRNAWLPIINGRQDIGNPQDDSAWGYTSNTSKKFSIGRSSLYDVDTLCGNHARLFYKDYSERINHTVQFVYYTDDPEHIAWTEEFIANCSLAQKANDINVTSTGLSLICKEATDAPLDTDTNWYEGVPSGASWWPTYQQLIDNNASYTDYINIVNEGSDYCIEVTWHTYNVITVASYNYINGKNMYKNLISFKKPEGAGATTRFYITFNDTKSSFVLDREQSGLLRKVAKVEYNGITNRGIIDL